MSFPYNLSKTEAAVCAAAWIAVLTLVPRFDPDNSPAIDAALDSLPVIAAAGVTLGSGAILYLSRKSILFPLLKKLRLR